MPDELESTELAGKFLAVAPRYLQWAAISLRAHRQDGDPSFRQLAMLLLIHQGVVSPAALAQRLGISRAVVTGLLDRLEERGLIRREPDPGDRRRLRIVMTTAGEEASTRLGRAVVEDLAGELSMSSASERQALASALPLLERLIASLLNQAPEQDESGRESELWDDDVAPPKPALALLN